MSVHSLPFLFLYLGFPCMFVFIRVVLHFSPLFPLLQQCSIGLCPSLNCWYSWNMFLCIFRHSSVSNSYLLYSSHTILISKRSAIVLFVGIPFLKLNILLYIIPFSSTYIGFPKESSFTTLYTFTQVSSPLLFQHLCSFFRNIAL